MGPVLAIFTPSSGNAALPEEASAPPIELEYDFPLEDMPLTGLGSPDTILSGQDIYPLELDLDINEMSANAVAPQEQYPMTEI